jgi:hypothetical protein
MSAAFTKDFRSYVRTLKKLSTSKRFSQNFARHLRGLLLDGLEITAGNRTTCATLRASMTLGISTSDDNLKLFSAFAAFDLLLNRKTPSHKRYLHLPNDKTHLPPAAPVVSSSHIVTNTNFPPTGHATFDDSRCR